MRSVLLVTQDLFRYGAQRQCVELALGLSLYSDWSVEVASLELNPNGPLRSELEDAGIPLHLVPRHWRWDISPARRLAQLVGCRKFAIVQSFLFLPNFYTRLLRFVSRPPLLVSSYRSTRIEGWHRHVTEMLMAPLCDLIVTNSEAGRNTMVKHGVSPSRIVVIRNGINLERFRRKRNAARQQTDGKRKRVIGMVARMDPVRSPETLVRAFAMVLAECPDVELILAGDGVLRPSVDKTVATLGLESSVRVLGTVDHPEEIYEVLDVYVQASGTREGTSNSILEAMASGCPVIASDVGANCEVVRHTETGLLVSPHEPSSLAQAILHLLKNPKEAQRMGEAGARTVRESYSRQVMALATLGIYETLLRKNEPRTTSILPSA